MVNGSVPDVSVGEQDELHSSDSRGIIHPWVILYPFVHGKWFVPDVSVGEDHKLCHVEKRAVCCEDASLFTALLLPIHMLIPLIIKFQSVLKGLCHQMNIFFEDLYKNK